MVLWLRKHQLILRILIALVITICFTFPYLTKDFLGIEHDTFFHLSRITGLATSIKEGNLFPSIYPYKNNGFGYASPLFYCDFFIIIPAIFYLLGLSLASSYKLLIFLFTFFAALSIEDLLSRISKNNKVMLLGAIAYTFSNYHITDVYVRGALGEVSAMVFLPILLSAIYEILYKHNTSKWYLLTLSLTGLIFSHNLTFLLGMIVLIIFVCINFKRMNKATFFSLFKGCFIAFLLTAWFTLPMLEQTSYQEMYLHYYGSSSSLESYTMPIWKFFANTTIFGYGENTQPVNRAMLVNVGWFLTLIPMFYFFKKKKNTFVYHSCILGYIFMILPISFIPWKYLAVIRIIQFPWRLELLAMSLLVVPASFIVTFVTKEERKLITSLCVFFLLVEGAYHLYPVYSRTFGISSTNTYEDITTGKLCDPYYSATYMRVELAGGDYLPIDSVDFRSYTPTIKTTNYEETGISYTKEGTTFTFEITDTYENAQLVLPITTYKGYRLYYNGEEISTSRFHGLLSFISKGSGTYILKYESTLLRKISFALSSVTLLSLVIIYLRRKYNR